jgi:putative spermidine/putrescine transport system ATP-binding protein
MTKPVETTALELVGVSKSFGPVKALTNVSLTLSRGEFLTMLGPSGSGKTTTLRIIAGFITPDAGEVRLHGVDVVRTPPYRRNIGMVFQDYALFPHMTALQNVGFPLEARGVAADERRKRVEAMLEVVGLGDFGDRYPRQLSGGQQQRVALARALVFDPEIVLLDEPLGALDKKLRGSMQLEILRIVRQLGMTVISVTHDQEEALVMSDRIALFAQGELAQVGTPRELYERPRTEFVADFIGEANILHGTFSLAQRHVVGPGWQADLSSANAARFQDGESVTLALRPENLRLEPSSASAAPKPNEISGEVRDAIYLGAEFRYTVVMQDGDLIQARSRDFRTAEALTPGAKVTATWNTDNAIPLKA